MAKLLKNFGEVRNEGKCISELRKQIKELSGLYDESIVKRVNESANEISKCRYFDFSYLELSEEEYGKEVMWVDTGFVNILGKTVYAQFTGGTPWTGALIGTEESILDYQKSYREAKNTTRETVEKELGVDLDKLDGVNLILDADEDKPSLKVNKNESFLNMLFDKLLIPHSWTINSIDNYINLCISRINNSIAKGKDCGKYVIFNNDCSCALINSGLLDRYGKYITIITRVYSSLVSEGSPMELGYTGLSLGGSKVVLSRNGFAKEDLNRNIERVSFSDNGVTDLIFTGTLDDFDLESRSRLEHCINERRSRFPDFYATATEEMICADITKAIELSIELNKYDRNYIKPIYNRNRDSIDFVIPYHVGNDFQKKPELGIVIAYLSEYWQIMTVLDYDDVIKDIKLFNMYENETF